MYSFTFCMLILCANVIDGQLLDELFSQQNLTSFIYKYHANHMCWDRAKKQCEIEGGTLFYPEDENEIKEMKKMVNAEEKEWIWLGVARTNGEFKTIDGRPIRDIYHKWAENEPNNIHNSEHCIVLDDSKYKDYHCNALLPFVCKQSIRALKRNIMHQIFFGNATWNNYEQIDKTMFYENTNDDNYTYIAPTMSLYKYHNNGAPWYEAMKQCELEKAILFYPRDENEAGLMIQFSNSTEYSAPWIWTGIYYCEKQRAYETIDGHSIKLVYTNSNPKPPEDKNGCASLLNDGTLSIMKCDKKLPFICKKAPQETMENDTLQILEENKRKIAEAEAKDLLQAEKMQIKRKSVNLQIVDDRKL